MKQANRRPAAAGAAPARGTSESSDGLGLWLTMAQRLKCVIDLAKKGALVHCFIRADLNDGTDTQRAMDRVFVELYQQLGACPLAIKMPRVPCASDKALGRDERSAEAMNLYEGARNRSEPLHRCTGLSRRMWMPPP